MSFYFNIKDYYHELIASPTTPYNSISEAAIEAKKYLVPRNTSDGYFIEIFDVSPEERISIALVRDPQPPSVYSEFKTQGEIAAFERVEPVYPNYIMEKVRQRLGLESWDTSQDEDINSMTHMSVFDHCLNWEGMIGYTLQIMDWVQDIYGVSLE